MKKPQLTFAEYLITMTVVYSQYSRRAQITLSITVWLLWQKQSLEQTS
jgi:hypothetical protein